MKSDRKRKTRITTRILFQYFLAMAIFIAALILGIQFCKMICDGFVWHKDDELYRRLKYIKENILSISLFIIVIGGTVITNVFIIRLLKYIDQIAAAAKKLTSPEEQAISLSGTLYEIEQELNLSRERALRSIELAKEAEKRKNDLIMYLAHDLKTPLTAVIGYLTLLKDEPNLSAEFRAKYTGIAYDKALRLEELINEFFDITRFNLTDISLNLQQINLSRMLEQTCDEFIPLMKEKGLTWDTSIAQGVMYSCDPDKLERVFDNLIRNSINYSYENTAISLKLEYAPQNITVTVENKGKTIPKEKLNRIFDQFFRLDSSRSTQTGGAGLGLAIAKEIVKLHGGEISAQSENEVIRFTVVLKNNM